MLDRLLPLSEIISGFGSLLLTGILAYLYFKMSATQKERTEIHKSQKDLMEKQSEMQEFQSGILREQAEAQKTQSKLMDAQEVLMEANQRPYLRIHEHRPINDISSEMEFLVSNIGKGAATNLELYTVPLLSEDVEETKEKTHFGTHIKYGESDYGDLTFAGYPNMVKRGDKEDNTTVQFEEEIESGEWHQSPDRYLEPGERRVPLRSYVALYIRKRRPGHRRKHPAPSAFEYGTELLYEAGFDIFRLKIVLKYEDLSGKVYTVEVGDLAVPVKGRTSLIPAIDNSAPYDGFASGPYSKSQLLDELEKDTGRTVIDE